MYTFARAADLESAESAQVGHEARRLAQHPERVAPGFVLSARFEEDFYRGNNLPEQLRTLFAPINPRRVDEDALEVLCDKAQTLLRGAFLLDDDVQRFYRALAGAALLPSGLGGAPTWMHVRRDGEDGAQEARVSAPGAEALFALKKVWVRDWGFEAVLDRLDTAGSVALEARPVLVFAGREGRPDAALAEVLGWPRALVNERGVVGA